MELWFTEKHTKGSGIVIKCKKTIYSAQSPFQQIDVLETEEFGRMLLLDGLVMTTEKDEFIYHEMLVHPPMHYHGNARNVLVVGGGDGGAVRELLRYPCIEHVTLCEIDKEVVETAKRFFPSLSYKLEDPRVEIVYQDGSTLLKESKDCFDLIVIDSTDPIGAAKTLFTREFYSTCKTALAGRGIVCAQSESPIYHLEIIKEMTTNVKAAKFDCVNLYTAPIPTYPGGFWSWIMACNDKPCLNKKAASILPSDQYAKLNYFNLDILGAAFCLPNFLKNILDES